MVPDTPPSDPPDRPSQLPVPDAAALAHSTRLQERIVAELQAAGGAIPFSRFMELALYAPQSGYYVAGARKFGAQGDFITAPEVSDLFSRCLARQCAQAFGGVPARLLEVGAGSGIMALNVLRELQRLERLPEVYWILEPSPDLQQRQQQCLAAEPELAQKVQWLEQWPPAFAGVVLANEVLDAMPVERFRVTGQGFEQACVGWREDGFHWTWRDAPAPLREALDSLQQQLPEPMSNGYESELSLWFGPWLQGLADCLTEGVALLIDYGYPRRERYHPQRRTGTLQCHYRHRVHDNPFLYVGLQDITAFVDFTAVAEQAHAAGFEVAGFTTQAQFLIGAGLTELLAQSDPSDMRAHLERMRQAKVLTLPGEMGERFKVMALRRGATAPLAGFSGLDLRGRL